MKFAIVFAVCCIAVAMAGPTDRHATTTYAPLLKHEESHNDQGYTVEFELGDGTLVHEHAEKAEGPEGEVFLRRVGYYKYKSPEGELIELHYTADENGFVAHGPHLPKSVQA